MAPDMDLFNTAPLSVLLTTTATATTTTTATAAATGTHQRVMLHHFLQSPSLHSGVPLPLPLPQTLLRRSDDTHDTAIDHVWQDVLQATNATWEVDNHSHSHNHSHNHSHQLGSGFDLQPFYTDDYVDFVESPFSSSSSPLPQHHNGSATDTNPATAPREEPLISAPDALESPEQRPRPYPARRGRRATVDETRVQRKREEKMKKERVRRALLNDRFSELAVALQLPEDSRADRLTLLTDSLDAIKALQAEVARLRSQLAYKDATSFLM